MFLKRLTETGNKTMPTSLNVDSPPSAPLMAPTSAHVSSVSGSVGSESERSSVVSDSLRPHRLYSPWSSPGQNTRMDSLSLLQGIFPTQGSNPGLLRCRWILYSWATREARYTHGKLVIEHWTNFLSWCWSSGAWAHPTCLSASPLWPWWHLVPHPSQICMRACSVPSVMSDSLWPHEL